MSRIRPLRSINDIVHDFDAFLIDLWGVVHDGASLYPNVKETIQLLKDLGKKVIFISNAPRQSHKVIGVLQAMGISNDYYIGVTTSGDITLKNASKYGKKYFYIGPEKDADLLNKEPYERVEQAKDADFALLTGYEHDLSPIYEKTPQLIEALNTKLLLICANPDLMVIRRTGMKIPCAGIIAMEYEKRGGKVHYYGKPYPEIYEECFAFLPGVAKTRIAAIGDGIKTDLKGAKSQQLYTIFCTGGICANKLRTTYGKLADLKDVVELCQKENIIPDAVIAGL